MAIEVRLAFGAQLDLPSMPSLEQVTKDKRQQRKGHIATRAIYKHQCESDSSTTLDFGPVRMRDALH